MMLPRARKRIFAVSFCLWLAAYAAPTKFSGQTLYGSLTGNITDASGGNVAGAKVQALNVGTGASKQVQTDEHGGYTINDLQAGAYKITISADSFGGAEQDNVPVDANAVRRVDVQLQVAKIKQSVTVNASAAALQTDRADVNTQIKSTQIANLPMGGSRNFQSLLKLVPGASPPAGSHSAAGNPQIALATNVNGASYNNNLTRIDGTIDSYPWLPEIVAYVPPAEAIESISIATASFDAEQGMAGGSAVNVFIKTGTNDFHGSAWEYNTISALKARNYFYYGANNPKNVFNQFGLTFGGPVIKNKLFFFVDWERYLQRLNVSGYQTIPTAALRQGNFAGTGTTIYDPTTGNANGTGRTAFANNQIPTSMLNPAALKMAALIPAVNQGNGIANDYFGSESSSFTKDNVDIKINYNPNDKSSAFGRYSFSPSTIFDPGALGPAGGNTFDGGQPGTATGNIRSAAAGATYSFTPNLLLDGNVGFTRQRLAAQNVDIGKNYGLDTLGIPGTNGPDRLQGGYPDFVISGFASLGNPNISNPFLFRDNQYVGAVNLSWSKGSHSLRFGVEIDHFGINQFQPQIAYGPRGGFNFTGGVTALNGGASPNLYNSWADFLLGLPQKMGKDYQYINPSAVRESSYAFYARDQWQVTRKFTLSYGLRYEFYPFATRDHFGGNRYDPGTNLVYLGGVNNVPNDTGVDVGLGQLAPRLGLAYRLTEKTVVRAGFGISIDPNNFRSMRDAYPAVISQQFVGSNSFVPAGSLLTGLPPVTGPDLSQGSFPLPSSVGTTTFPQTINRGYIESYNFTIQRDMGAGFNAQAAYVGTRSIRQFSFVNINAAGPGSGNAGTPLFEAWGNPNTVNFVEPFNSSTYNSLQTQVTRRLGDNTQLGVVYTYSRAINYTDNGDSGLTWAWTPMWDRNKAVAGFNRPHNFQVYGTYDLPFGPGQTFLRSGVAGKIAGGWKLNAILSRTSGTTFTVTASGASVNAPGNTQTADQVLSNVKILGGHGPGSPYFDPNAFAPVTAVRFGTSGRDTLRGPGLFNLDASLFRDFALTERFKLEFRAESFGLTNTPQFANPGDLNVSDATRANGAITNYNGYDIINSAGGERQLRFALKFTF